MRSTYTSQDSPSPSIAEAACAPSASEARRAARQKALAQSLAHKVELASFAEATRAVCAEKTTPGRLFAILALSTGARAGDLANAKWADFSLGGPAPSWTYVSDKTRKQETVALDAEALGALAAARLWSPPGCLKVFPGFAGPSAIAVAFSAFARKRGLPSSRFHNLRAAHQSQLRAK